MFFWRNPKPKTLLQNLSEKADTLMLDLTAIKADIASLSSEVSQAVAMIQANASAAQDAAANQAAIADLDSQIKTLRDQLAAALAPAPVAQTDSTADATAPAAE